jgi:flagellar protein FlaI
MYDLAFAIDTIKGALLKKGLTTTSPKLKTRQCATGTELAIDCSACNDGTSGIADPACRRCVIQALSGQGNVEKLLLERDLVREYSGDRLSGLIAMASFCGELGLRASGLRKFGCGKCDAGRKEKISAIVELSRTDQAAAADAVDRLFLESYSGSGRPGCRECQQHFASLVGDMSLAAAKVRDIDYSALVPYVMPRFSRSMVLEQPPAGAAFLRSYDVKPGNSCLAMHVTIYSLPESPEKLYFAMPWEYAIDREDLSLIVDARERLLKRRPDGEEFLDVNGARAFFARHAKSSIMNAAAARDVRVEAERLERLAGTFVKYTSGLGIMEDVLADPHIQDAYVNAPVGATPLHVVVDGEECTSNLYLSESDVESMISRLRAISGRPFSEASPVLDMDLGQFHTRVSVIGSPLSRGLAYAFRRHKKTPWTLPQLVSHKMLSPYAAGLLSLLVDGHASMLITGTRGAGKTSLLSALMLEIPQSYRILAIEDTPELPVEDMQRHGWKVQGIGTRAAVSGSEAEFQASDALRAALRLGESALIIGEVRGIEARSLYEAMRVGASGNSVMGTIHGASCRDVLERVVQDIGVPPASFKATDAVVVCSTVRPHGGSRRERRLIEIAEVEKGEWGDDPEGAFDDLLTYDASYDLLRATDRIDTGRSEVLKNVARRWGLTIEEVNNAAAARGGMIGALAEAGRERPSIMEVESYARCVNMFRVTCDDRRYGRPDYAGALQAWEDWLCKELRGGPREH